MTLKHIHTIVLAAALVSGSVGIALAAEEYAPGRRTPGDQEHRLRLREPREIVEVAVEAVWIVRIAVAHAFRSRGNERHAALHFGSELRPPPLIDTHVHVGRHCRVDYEQRLRGGFR